MRLTIRRINLNREGRDSHGVYWGVGERLYYCPTIDNLGARQGQWPHAKTDAYCCAPDLASARRIFRLRLESSIIAIPKESHS